MNDADAKVKQQIVEKIKGSTNILVAVSKNPSVDDLSAALGLTVLLNKLGKHATAIFSGTIPPAITFLEPDKVFEDDADSLRDFIIALDKEKADHLRYKVEGDVVKIFITPYHTTITSDDLEFSQGDFNVELVLALGIADQDNLDLALAAHGRILHDVTVVTFSAGEQTSNLGSLDWHDDSASSLSEMITIISELLKGDKPVLDKQIATALLTGIVSATDRFSNTRTSSRVMTLAAQLMAAGADQQLIAAKLQESHEINSLQVNQTNNINSSSALGVPAQSAEPVYEQSTLPPGGLKIDHQPEKIINQSANNGAALDNTSTLAPDIPDLSISDPNLDRGITPSPTESVEPVNPISISSLVDSLNGSLQHPPIGPSQIQGIKGVLPSEAIEPSLGAPLNATIEQADEDLRHELDNQQNKTILEHSYLKDDSKSNTAINSVGQGDATEDVNIFDEGSNPNMPQPINLPMPPPLPDFSTLPPPITVQPLSPDVVEPVTASEISTLPPSLMTPDNNDPSQFRIPGQ